MKCIMIEVNLNSSKVPMAAVRRQELKTLVLRAITGHVPEASISYTGTGQTDFGTAWLVLAHVAEELSQKTILGLQKAIETYMDLYGVQKCEIGFLEVI